MDFRGRHNSESFRGEFQGGSGPSRRARLGVEEGGFRVRAGAGLGGGMWPDFPEHSWAFWGYERGVEPLLSGRDSQGGGTKI